MGLGNCLHLSLATNGLPPSGTDLCESPCSTAAYYQSSEANDHVVPTGAGLVHHLQSLILTAEAGNPLW